MNQQNKIEKICWINKPKDNIHKILGILLGNKKCIAGFIIEENDLKVKISSTIGSRGFRDIVEIDKKSIICRQELNTKKV